MPTNRKRVYVTPNTKALVRLGIDPSLTDVTSSALAGAIERYSDLLPLAASEVARIVRRSEWGLIAEAIGETRFPSAAAKELPALLVVIDAIELAHRTRRIGDIHLLTLRDSATFSRSVCVERVDRQVRDLCDRLRGLSPLHGDAIMAGVRWFLTHPADLMVGTREWWLPGTRVDMYEKTRKQKQKGPQEPDWRGTLLEGTEPDKE